MNNKGNSRNLLYRGLLHKEQSMDKNRPTRLCTLDLLNDTLYRKTQLDINRMAQASNHTLVTKTCDINLQKTQKFMKFQRYPAVYPLGRFSSTLKPGGNKKPYR